MLQKAPAEASAVLLEWDVHILISRRLCCEAEQVADVGICFVSAVAA